MFLIETEENVGFLTAAYVKNKIKTFIPSESKPFFILALPTGGTSIDLYKYLVQFYKKGSLNFDKVVTFNLDEYVGLPVTHPESYHSFMARNLFDHIQIKKEQINSLNGNTENLEKECQDYEQKIKNLGGIDLFLGGVGENGHIAFNEPGSAFDSKTRIINLTENTIKANSRFFNGDINLVPKRALTIGLGTIMQSKEIIIMATGPKKANAVYHAFEDKPNTKYPITILQKHPRSFIVTDKAAAAELSSRTKKDFGFCSFIK